MTSPDPVSFCAVVVAGGAGRRFGGEVPKQFLSLGGMPVLVHTLLKFEAAPEVSRVVLVLPAEKKRWFETDILPEHQLSKLSEVVTGGETRQASVRHGLTRVDATREPFVAVHDGVRPFFDPRWLAEGLTLLSRYPAVAVGVSPTDTVKRVSSQRFTVATPKRESLVLVQTPQMFHTRLIREAHEKAKAEGWAVSDDTALMERMGHPVKILEGNRWNLKITEPSDLRVGETLLRLGKEKERAS